MEVRSPETEAEFRVYYDLRWRVLREPWGQPLGSERDEHDVTATHVAGYDEAKRIVCVGRLHAVGTDLGQAVLDEIERLAKQQGMRTIVLDAREAAVGFYLRNGYVATGDGHTLFGEVRHTKMEKSLTGSA